MSIQTTVISHVSPLRSFIRRFEKTRRVWINAGFGALCAGLLVGCGSSPIEVAIETKDNPVSDGQMTYLVVTSKVDDVQIKKVSANRGNCKILGYEGSPHLKFGNQLRTLMWCNGNPIQEAEVETSKDKYSYTF
ncbi:MAG: hypothetical protein Q7U16_04965 [Agitococcus sp.]|nr:hypothetical protein [Agitococcus sp.]